MAQLKFDSGEMHDYVRSESMCVTNRYYVLVVICSVLHCIEWPLDMCADCLSLMSVAACLCVLHAALMFLAAQPVDPPCTPYGTALRLCTSNRIQRGGKKREAFMMPILALRFLQPVVVTPRVRALDIIPESAMHC